MNALRDVLTARATNHVYRDGIDATSPLPEEQRIETTVLIKAPRWIGYGDVIDLIELIKQTGAGPIGLVAVSED